MIWLTTDLWHGHINAMLRFLCIRHRGFSFFTLTKATDPAQLLCRYMSSFLFSAPARILYCIHKSHLFSVYVMNQNSKSGSLFINKYYNVWLSGENKNSYKCLILCWFPLIISHAIPYEKFRAVIFVSMELSVYNNHTDFAREIDRYIFHCIIVFCMQWRWQMSVFNCIKNVSVAEIHVILLFVCYIFFPRFRLYRWCGDGF